MADGVVILSDNHVGTFLIVPPDAILIALNNGQNVRETFEHASANGITIELLLTPPIPGDEGEDPSPAVDPFSKIDNERSPEEYGFFSTRGHQNKGNNYTS